MQPETHETHYRNLLNITARIKSALDEKDARTLLQLAEEHRNVMDKLDRAGSIQEIELLDLIKETRDRVNEIVAEIGKQRDELGGQFVMFEKKKKASTAYVKNG